MSHAHHETVIAPIRPANRPEGDDAHSIDTIREADDEAESKSLLP